MLSSAFSAVAVALLPFVAGCSDDDPVAVGTPYPPDGVFSVTGDGFVTIYWNENWEADLKEYGVYRCDDRSGLCETTSGEYVRIATVPASQTWYDDTNVNNGETWYYAVTAINDAGNESELSYELVFDTPRPAGKDLALYDCMGQNRDQSGYDFSSESGLADSCSSQGTDIYFESSGGVDYIRTTAGVDIQDWGWTFSLDDLDWAPEVDGWAPSGTAEAIPEHSYFVRIVGAQGTNYAKIRVTSVTGVDVDNRHAVIDWAYQPVAGNPELTPGTKGGASK